MARAEIATWLPLSEWARRMGYDPVHFAQLVSTDRPASNCDNTIFQHSWQLQAIGREDIARAIDEAERRITEMLGYNLIPDWSNERLTVTGPWNPATLHSGVFAANGFGVPVTLSRRRYISGGVRANELLGADAAIVWPGGVDETYAANRLATITVPGVATDLEPCEVRVYFRASDRPSEFDLANPADDWEITPLERVSVSGTTLTITVRRELLVDPAIWEALAPESGKADENATFVTAVDVYRVFNDPQTQAQLEYLPSASGAVGCGTCHACQIGTQSGCLVARDAAQGMVTMAPAVWNPDEETFDSVALSFCRGPDRILARYRSGLRSERTTCERVMDPTLARAVGIYAASLLPGSICGCEVSDRIRMYRMEANVSRSEAFTFAPQPWQLNNPLGQTVGAIEAWRLIRGRAEGASSAVPTR